LPTCLSNIPAQFRPAPILNDTLYFVSEDRISLVPNAFEAYWFSLVSVTTLGYGDIFPRHPLGLLLTALVILAGSMYLAVPVSVMCDSFLQAHQNVLNNEVSTKAEMRKMLNALHESREDLSRMQQTQQQQLMRGTSLRQINNMNALMRAESRRQTAETDHTRGSKMSFYYLRKTTNMRRTLKSWRISRFPSLFAFSEKRKSRKRRSTRRSLRKQTEEFSVYGPLLVALRNLMRRYWHIRESLHKSIVESKGSAAQLVSKLRMLLVPLGGVIGALQTVEEELVDV
jgi:hypothetical protein